MNLAQAPEAATTPDHSHRTLGGAILGGLLALGRRPRRPLVVSNLTTLGFPLPPLALALHLPVAAVAGGALLAGLGPALGSAISLAVTQQQVPAGALARGGSVNLGCAVPVRPVAFAPAGPLDGPLRRRALLCFRG